MSWEAWGDDDADDGRITIERGNELFVEGLQAMREMLARFIEPVDPMIAMSIRANWDPRWGRDPGRPDEVAGSPW
jgi:hypothetical protein